MKIRVAAGLLVALMAGLAPPAGAQPLPNLDVRADVSRELSAGHTLLTGPSDASPESIALGYVRDELGLDTADLELVARSVSADGITHLRYNQVLDGIWSYDSGIDAHVAADGRLIGVSGRPVRGARLSSKTPSVSALAGLGVARRVIRGLALPPRVTRSGRSTTFSTGETANLRWIATEDGPRPAWDVYTESGGNAYSVVVDAESGRTLVRTARTHQLGRIRYFPRDPDTTAPIEITMPPSWYDEHNGGTRLWGQYSRTYVDPLDEDPAGGSEQGGNRRQIPASGGAPNSPDWLYSRTTNFPGATPCPPSGCSWNSASAATRVTNERQAGANVHALVGHFLEHLARPPIGFDEASGNFQRVNAGAAGRGGDYIRTEVNDGQGLNNANFSTPADGSPPRMQMFLFSALDANGSDSADVVYHEIGHGLSNRLVVNASGGGALGLDQSEMMGEAWSDFYALDLLVHEGHLTDTAAPAELRVGTHVVGPDGVRSKPIDCPVDPAGVAGCNRNGTVTTVLGGYTYGDIKDTANAGGPHNGGEVWGETLWDIRTAVGREAALALITGGLRMTPDNPSMLDARDAILRQSLAMRSASGAADDHYARLWAVFQSRGMGFDASTPNADSTTPTESFAAPRHQISLREPVLSDPYPGGDNDGRFEPGERIEVSGPVFSPGLTDLAGVTGTLSSPDATIVDGSAAWPALGNGRTSGNNDSLAARMPASCSKVVPLTVSVTSTAGGATATAFADPRRSSRTILPLADTPTDGTAAVTEATYVVTGGGTITDINVRIDELRHTWLGDLKIELIHDGVTVTLFEPPAGYDADDIVDAVFDSDSANPVVNAGPGPVTGTMRPQVPGALNQFDGHSADGVWTLRISDDGAGDSGALREWGVEGAPSEFPCPRLEIPSATTGGAADVTTGSATVDGTVVPRGRATGVRFAYGESSAYGSVTATQDVGAGEAAVARSASLTGLKPGTTYHYRVEAIRENGQVAVTGADATFTTAPAVVVGVAPTPTPTPTPTSAPDRTAPALTATRVSLTRVRRTARRRATFAFSLSEPARVTATVTRAAKGIRRGSRCVAVPRRKPRRARPCTRRLPAATGSVRLTAAGRATLRLPARGLAKGRYTATLTAVDAAGNRSTTTVRFTIR